MESLQEAMQRLKAQLHGYPWFANHVGPHDKLHHCIVAYVHYMAPETETIVPQTVDGWQVRVHFIASIQSKHVSTVQTTSLPLFNPATLAPAKPVVEDELTLAPALDVHNEIWKLQRLCGRDNLIDIFYEVHDGDDAVTNFSESHPEVRAELQKLYNEFGFDVLFEELDA